MAHASSATTELLGGGFAIVGRGRMGRALTAALIDGGIPVRGPLGRGESAAQDAIVLLCVPDREIAAASHAVAPGRLVGHCSGTATLDVLRPHEAFSLHPLMTAVVNRPTPFAGAGCAVAGSTERARAVAHALAESLGMRGVEVRDGDRALYHAAASMASNYLVTLETSAEMLAAQVGVERALLVPLVRAAVENWAEHGARALTGPIARGDQETAERQRAAIAERSPELLPLWDALAARTAELAAVSRRDA